MTDALLKLTDVDIRYGAVTAVRNASLIVGQGEITAILGANGAGKSSLIRAIAGVVAPSAGTIEFPPGTPIQGKTPDAVHRMGIAWVPEGRDIFVTLTVRENLAMGAFDQRDKAAVESRMRDMFRLFPVLSERSENLGSALSGGEQQMLAIARALMGEPKLLLLDEPSLGLAPLLIQQVYDAIRSVNSAGVAVLLVEQNARVALDTAEWCYLMESGRITSHAPSTTLKTSDVIQQTYLGGGA